MREFSIGGNRFGLFIYGWRDWWFRVFGYGLSTRPLKGHQPLFSERNGMTKAYHVLGQCWKPLKPWKKNLK